jgi:hypothetical protein
MGVTISQIMTRRILSQRTVTQVKRVLDGLGGMHDRRDLLYEHDFPDWFIRQTQRYAWNWIEVLWDLRSGTFFYTENHFADEDDTIIPNGPLAQSDAIELGELFIRKLAALAVVFLPELPSRTIPIVQSLPRLLQLDGFDVDRAKVKLVLLEGPISAEEEEDRLTRLVKTSGIPNIPTVLKHIEDASSLYADEKDHPSLNESRSLIQALIDGISTETSTKGKHSTKLPGGTSNRIKYLKDVGFFTPDDEAAYNSGWGTLSAGSHPGVPEREQARIGLVLALEFGQLLLIKFTNWKANAYRGFSLT